VASAGRENLDADHVARYDAEEDAGAVEQVALLRRWGLANRSVDVGAGIGIGIGSSRSSTPSSVWPTAGVCARSPKESRPWSKPRSCA